MKLIFYFIILVILSINTYPEENKNMEKIKSIIEQVKEKFAPDKRVAIFNIQAEDLDSNIIIKGETNLPEAATELQNLINKLNLKFKNQIEILPAKNLKDNIYGIINLSVANFRSKPEHPAELATQALLGTPVKVYKKGVNGYYLIQTPDGYISWLDDDGFFPMNKNEFDSWNKSNKIIFIKECGFSFSEPNINSQHVSDLVAGNLLKLVSDSDDFYEVEYPDRRVAFIKKEEAALFDNWYKNLNPNGEAILNTAFKFMGIPYLWGGTSPKAMDCSGFTKTVYYLNGIILKRDASQQVNTGEIIDTKNGYQNLQPGDLLFFGTPASANSKEKVTHVAIYIADGDFIHASGSVRINSLNPKKSYYSKGRDNSFLRAKRILTSIGKNGIEKILENSFYKNKN